MNVGWIGTGSVCMYLLSKTIIYLTTAHQQQRGIGEDDTPPLWMSE